MSTASHCSHSYPAGVLIASANADLRKRLARRLFDAQWLVDEALGGADALGKLELKRCRLLLLDCKLPDLNADDVIGIVESRFPGTDVVMLDSATGLPQIPPELRDSAPYTMLGPWATPVDQPISSVQEERAPLCDDLRLPGMMGDSETMQTLYRHATLVARRNTAVLITGETGSGKELVAQAIHALSLRAHAPFVTVNCAAIPETLLEAELFGHTRGAFTGAVQSRNGKVQGADGGTLFLDEIGEITPAIQAKLLRFLENGEVQRLGATETTRVDARVIAATNASLPERVSRHEFREDLYYRLSVFPVVIPPLRQRGEDILVLARHFVREFAGHSLRLSDDANRLLLRHAWPGNVRELRHVVERACIFAEDSGVLLPEHFSLG